ncbi:unnamed protein product [Porites evermanni]|uniref:Uncharacterized protein n=1 Tax=Porites evermanni TaxID=104178 RepID=A0ABN8RSP7_9CNID|nr:unnamed protein product [Porites evermanni]
MSDNDTLLKGKRVLRASSFDEWRRAPRPNYNVQGNLDLEFPYSEYPRNQPYEYHSVQLPRPTSKQILDFWGEGRIASEGLITGFPGAYNVNHQFQLVSNGADIGKKIPNRIPTIDYQTVSVEKYVSDGTFNIITLMGAPIINTTAAEIARIISGNSHSQVVTYGFSESDENITKLKRELDAKKLIILADYILPHPLDEITITPALAFRPLNSVVSQARLNFINWKISPCAKILCSLQRSSHDQNSAKEALSVFFNDDGVKNSFMIFALGYELDTTSDGKAVMNIYMNSNVVKIVRFDYRSLQLQSSNGKAANLCPYDKVTGSKSWDWGFFGSSGYENDGDKLTLVRADSTRFKIRADYGTTSFLCVESVGSDSCQYAFFGTALYNQSYDDGQYFRLYPVSGGEKFKVQANFGETSYLCVDKVSTWNDAFFGTSKYIYDGGYSAGETLKVIFH